MPAALTLISTSPGPGSGMGRSTGTSTSDRRGGRFQQPSSCLLGSKWIIIAPLRMACKPSPAKRLPGDRRRPDTRKRGRAVEGTGLENRQGFTPFVGSNPTASANTMPRMALSLASFRYPTASNRAGSLPSSTTKNRARSTRCGCWTRRCRSTRRSPRCSRSGTWRPEREAATKLPGVRSWAANWTLGGQEVSAQLTCADADSAGYLRNAYPYTS